MRADATTVKEYLDALPADRRRALSAVRKVIRKRLPPGYVESMNWGMICYEVPLKTFANTYNGKPLMYAALASQKNHMALYLTGCYIDPDVRAQFERAFAASGKRLDAGKSCVRFRSLEDLPLDVVGDAVARCSVDEFVGLAQQAHGKKPRRAQRKR